MFQQFQNQNIVSPYLINARKCHVSIKHGKKRIYFVLDKNLIEWADMLSDIVEELVLSGRGDNGDMFYINDIGRAQRCDGKLFVEKKYASFNPEHLDEIYNNPNHILRKAAKVVDERYGFIKRVEAFERAYNSKMVMENILNQIDEMEQNKNE